MIDPVYMAVLFTGFIILFFSVHLYMDINMFRLRRSTPSEKSGTANNQFMIPVWAKVLAFTPSLVFWILFITSPVLFYCGLYEKMASLRVPYEDAVQAAGIVLVLAGVLLADWGRVSRGVIAPSLNMPDTYVLTTRGAYALVRHPMYVSYSLFFVGIPLIFLNVFLFLCIIGIPGYYRIAQSEESVLIKRFGNQYKDYQRTVGMFIPKL
jgi:protein-S-isoprenylcysteine O-methyltransferase Ste14